MGGAKINLHFDESSNRIRAGRKRQLTPNPVRDFPWLTPNEWLTLASYLLGWGLGLGSPATGFRMYR